MALATHILKELQEISPIVSAVEPVMPYTVPADYFDTFPALVLLRIRVGDTATAADEETSALSPLLGSIKNKMPYSVPNGYFEKLASGSQVKQEPAGVIRG